MSHITEPQLAPPGAGLPDSELFIGVRLFALKRWFGSREVFTATFKLERAAIRDLVNSCPHARRGERVLIPRLRGLEDSSRFWSVWMTLDHLRITNSNFTLVITSLAQGKVPQRMASTAAVESAFEESCDKLLDVVAEVFDLKTTVSFAHPWFGLLDAFGWHALSAMHLGIHRAQIAQIIARLAK